MPVASIRISPVFHDEKKLTMIYERKTILTKAYQFASMSNSAGDVFGREKCLLKLRDTTNKLLTLNK